MAKFEKIKAKWEPIGRGLQESCSRHRNRWLYFALLTVAGGLGSWITGCQHLHDSQKTSGYAFCASLGTFSISLAVMSLADLWVLSQNGSNLTRGLALLLAVLFSGICGAVALFELQTMTILASWLSFVSAAAAWWGTHAWNPALDRNDALTTMGGSV